MRKHKILPEDEEEKPHDLSVFDKEDPNQHLEKVLIGNGLYAGLRGVSEHVNLLCAQVVLGVYRSGHEFKGMKWAGLDLRSRKTNKLSSSNVYFSEMAEVNRQPVWDDQPNSACWAGSLLRFRNKFGPNQVRFYCYPASKMEMKFFVVQGYPDARYSPTCQIGRNRLVKIMHNGARRQGFSNPDKITGHMFRRAMITTLVNDLSVNITESMQAVGHQSVSAHMAYIQHDKASEAARVKALLSDSAVEKIKDFWEQKLSQGLVPSVDESGAFDDVFDNTSLSDYHLPGISVRSSPTEKDDLAFSEFLNGVEAEMPAPVEVKKPSRFNKAKKPVRNPYNSCSALRVDTNVSAEEKGTFNIVTPALANQTPSDGAACGTLHPSNPTGGIVSFPGSTTTVSSALTADQKERALRNKANALSIRLQKLTQENQDLKVALESQKREKQEVEQRLQEETGLRDSDLQGFEANETEMKSTISHLHAELEFFCNWFYNHGI